MWDVAEAREARRKREPNFQVWLPSKARASPFPLSPSTAPVTDLPPISMVYSLAINICFCLKSNKYQRKSVPSFLHPGKGSQGSVSRPALSLQAECLHCCRFWWSKHSFPTVQMERKQKTQECQRELHTPDRGNEDTAPKTMEFLLGWDGFELGDLCWMGPEV